MFTNNTFVPSVEVCTNDQTTTLAACTSRRGGLLDINTSGSTFVDISSIEDVPPDTNWAAIQPTDNILTDKGNTTLLLPSDTALQQFPIKVFKGGQNHNAGHLGLGESSVILEKLAALTGLVTGFGLDAGSQSTLRPRDGHIVIGGYDKQRVSARVKEYNISNARSSERVCSLRVVITELVLVRPGIDDYVLSSRGEEIPACIEPCEFSLVPYFFL